MEFTVKYFGQTKLFDKKVKLIDLLPSDDIDTVGAIVNRRIRDLNYEICADSEITFLTVKDYPAIRIYESSLRYLVAMAIHEIDPELKVRFCYNVSRSVFIQPINKIKQFSPLFIEQIDAKMKELIAKDYKLNRMAVTKEEAIEIYKKNDELDKIEVVEYRPEKTVHFYECNGYLNYTYSKMVPSTKYLGKYKIFFYPPGMILQYPRSETKGEIPPFEDAQTFGKTLKESHTWAAITGADTVAGINKHVKENGEVEFIELCEARHNKMLSELGDNIEKEISNLRVICIAGPSSSGKTTFANKLRIELLSRGIKTTRISLDDYFLPRNQIPLTEYGEPDFETIEALDIELFNQNMLDLVSGKEVQLPKFDFKLGKRVPGRILKLNDNEPVIIEGIHALNERMTASISKNQKYLIFIAPQAQINYDNINPVSLTDLRLLRRMVRDYKFRNSPAIETLGMWANVRKGEFKWIYSNQENADYVFNSMLSYELCVMRKYALPLLLQIDKENEYFLVAERLIRLLKYFVDISDKWIPCDSLMREFIGGSCFEEDK